MLFFTSPLHDFVAPPEERGVHDVIFSKGTRHISMMALQSKPKENSANVGMCGGECVLRGYGVSIGKIVKGVLDY